MFQPSRRALFASAALLVPGTLLLSGCSTSFSAVQSYVATAVSAIDALAPIAEAIDPSISGQLNSIVSQANAAAAAFAALTSPTAGAGTAQTIITLVEDALTLAESVPGLPASAVAIVGSVELLLVTIGAFFGVPPSVANTEVALEHPAATATLRAAAVAQYNAATDKQGLAAAAQTQVRAWLATQ